MSGLNFMKGFDILKKENVPHYKYDGCYYLSLDLAVQLIRDEMKQGNTVTIKDIKGNNLNFYANKSYNKTKLTNESIKHKLIDNCKGICYDTCVVTEKGKKTRHCFLIDPQKMELEYKYVLSISDKIINFLWDKRGILRNVLVVPEIDFCLTHDTAMGTLSYVCDEKYKYMSKYTRESVKELLVEELSEMTDNHIMYHLKTKVIKGVFANTLVLYMPRHHDK